nr:hypothetical protein GCM10020241_55210 [Streptoalloteichus tenebrarius]
MSAPGAEAAKHASQSSSVRSGTSPGRNTPTTLTRNSTDPSHRSTTDTDTSTAEEEAMSEGKPETCSPVRRNSGTAEAGRSRSPSRTATRAPASASVRTTS